MQTLSKIETLYYVLASAGILAVPIRYIYKWFRHVDKAVTNEIPHMHAYLVRICQKLDIDIIDLRGDDAAYTDSERSRNTSHKG